jgi:hypothetical protein
VTGEPVDTDPFETGASIQDFRNAHLLAQISENLEPQKTPDAISSSRENRW